MQRGHQRTYLNYSQGNKWKIKQLGTLREQVLGLITGAVPETFGNVLDGEITHLQWKTMQQHSETQVRDDSWKSERRGHWLFHGRGEATPSFSQINRSFWELGGNAHNKERFK